MGSNRKLEAAGVCGEASNSWSYPEGDWGCRSPTPHPEKSQVAIGFLIKI